MESIREEVKEIELSELPSQHKMTEKKLLASMIVPKAPSGDNPEVEEVKATEVNLEG